MIELSGKRKGRKGKKEKGKGITNCLQVFEELSQSKRGFGESHEKETEKIQKIRKESKEGGGGGGKEGRGKSIFALTFLANPQRAGEAIAGQKNLKKTNPPKQGAMCWGNFCRTSLLRREHTAFISVGI